MSRATRYHDAWRAQQEAISGSDGDYDPPEPTEADYEAATDRWERRSS